MREERAEEVKRGRKWKGIGRIVVGRKERGRREGKKERREEEGRERRKGERRIGIGRKEKRRGEVKRRRREGKSFILPSNHL